MAIILTVEYWGIWGGPVNDTCFLSILNQLRNKRVCWQETKVLPVLFIKLIGSYGIYKASGLLNREASN